MYLLQTILTNVYSENNGIMELVKHFDHHLFNYLLVNNYFMYLLINKSQDRRS